MGKGVGPIFCWVAFLKVGSIFLEILSFKSNVIVCGILSKAISFLPFKATFLF